MTDFTQRLFDRYSEEKENARANSDKIGEKVFFSMEEFIEFVSPNEAVALPDEVAAELVKSAIQKQRKWSPDEAKPKWSLALNILKDEAVSLKISR